LIGADPAFLSYKKGVFTSTKGGKCDFSQSDHAMLIVGYGEEKMKHHHVQKYWIARNSWGSGWGENGYIKIARSSGKKGDRGVCDIARSPSIALGGTFTKEVNLGNKLYGSTMPSRGGYGGGLHDGDSFTARASDEIQSRWHRLRTRLGFIEDGIQISTNNGNQNRGIDMLLPYALVIAMFAFCLTLVQGKWKRRGAQRSRQQGGIERRRISTGTQESFGTNCSTITIRENSANSNTSQVTISFHHNDGERMHLLENSGGSRYT